MCMAYFEWHLHCWKTKQDKIANFARFTKHLYLAAVFIQIRSDIDTQRMNARWWNSVTSVWLFSAWIRQCCTCDQGCEDFPDMTFLSKHLNVRGNVTIGIGLAVAVWLFTTKRRSGIRWARNSQPTSWDKFNIKVNWTKHILYIFHHA